MDADWARRPKGRDWDCYFRVDYPFYLKEGDALAKDNDVDKHADQLKTFLAGLYWDNSAAFTLRLVCLKVAFARALTGKMVFEVGHGGDGKGAEGTLEATVLGKTNAATLDCSCFVDRQEFRKSAELAWNKAAIRVQEMTQAAAHTGVQSHRLAAAHQY